MASRLLGALVLTLALAAVPATAQAAAPPQLVTSQWLLRVPVGAATGYVARATDPDGDAVTVTWAFDDGTSATGERVAKTWSTPGPHTGTVTATDTTGRATSRSFAIEVVADAATAPQPAAVSVRRPGPSPAAAARVAAAAGALRLAADGTVAIVLACAPGADCAGRVALAHGGHRLAHARFAIAAGQRTTVRLALRPAAVARLRRRAARAVLVTVVPAGQAAARLARVLRTA